MTDTRSLLARLRVPLGFLIALLFLVFSSPSWLTLVIGFPIALAGAFIRGWASGHLQKNQALATGGPYAFTRNPLYFGSFVMTLGCAVAGGSTRLAFLLIIFFLVVYLPVMKSEADHMSQLFAQDYRAWARETPLFFPRMAPYSARQDFGFDRALYLKHREYRVLLGLATVFGVLIVKVMRPF